MANQDEKIIFSIIYALYCWQVKLHLSLRVYNKLMRKKIRVMSSWKGPFHRICVHDKFSI